VTDAPSLSVLADAVRSAADDRARRDQLGARIAVAERLAADRRGEHESLRESLRIEEADVRRLERVSPTRLWATLRGDVDERLAVERAEATAAANALAAAGSRLQEAEAAAERLRRERDGLGDVDGSYARALAAYEEGLRSSGSPVAAELAHVAENLGAATADRREIDEAAAALTDARVALHAALERLESAGGWSTYDTFFGGGMIADLVKHDRLDAATAAFTQVNRALERLSTELADIDAPAVRGVEISQSLAVFDVLFDNILSDWMVRDRIAQARQNAVDLDRRLAELDRYLDQRSADTAGVIAALTRRREDILTAG